MPLSHDHIRTTVETYLARHPHEREQIGGRISDPALFATECT